MVYGPRDAEEVSTVHGLVQASHRNAVVGVPQSASGSARHVAHGVAQAPVCDAPPGSTQLR